MSDPVDVMAAAFQDELVKIAEHRLKTAAPKGKTLATMAAGAAGFETLRRANNDRKMGRMVRLQQGG